MKTKTITMTWQDETGGDLTFTQTYDRDCSWMAIAYQFHKFLLSMGYAPEGEEVGADVGCFISSTENL